jgi:hypothetical protein
MRPPRPSGHAPPLACQTIAVLPRSARSRLVVEIVTWPPGPCDNAPREVVTLTVRMEATNGTWIPCSGKQSVSLRPNEMAPVLAALNGVQNARQARQ